VWEWLSAFTFLPIPSNLNHIPISMPAKHLFPFPLFSHIDIPIPSRSHYRLTLTTLWNNINGHSYSNILHKTQHYCFSNTNPRHNFNTIHHYVTEDGNKSSYGPLCASRKPRSQSVA